MILCTQSAGLNFFLDTVFTFLAFATLSIGLIAVSIFLVKVIRDPNF